RAGEDSFGRVVFDRAGVVHQVAVGVEPETDVFGGLRQVAEIVGHDKGEGKTATRPSDVLGRGVNLAVDDLLEQIPGGCHVARAQIERGGRAHDANRVALYAQGGLVLRLGAVAFS